MGDIGGKVTRQKPRKGTGDRWTGSVLVDVEEGGGGNNGGGGRGKASTR